MWSFLILAISMLLAQYHLDSNRRLSLHCVLRNTCILLCYHLHNNGTITISYAHSAIILLILELIIEFAHQKGFTLDPYHYKVINYYRWADTLWSSKLMKQMDSYAEGKYDADPHMPQSDGLIRKFEWMAEQAGVSVASKETSKERQTLKILEIGPGNGEFMKYLMAQGVDAYGITPSPDQVALLTSKGFKVKLGSVWAMPDEFLGMFDAVVLNGSTEHFLNTTEKPKAKQLYGKMFDIVNSCLNPSSGLGKVVITAIHQHRKFSMYEWWQIYLLERSYGGFYPSNQDVYVEAASSVNLKLLLRENHTMDYYIFSNKVYWNMMKGMWEWQTALRHLIDIPVFILVDPYFVHKWLHILFGTWPWQFQVPYFPLLSHDDTPPFLHLWLVFERISN